MDINIRPIRPDEMDFLIDLAAAEGWNPGLRDGDAFYAADPEGFLVAEKDGEKVGCISGVSYGGIYGFLGFFIVLPDYRAQGIGHDMWAAVERRLEGHVNGMDGVVAQQENYRSAGYVKYHRSVRYKNVTGGERFESPLIAPASSVDFADILAYDKRAFGVEREAFLRAWLAMDNAIPQVIVDEGRIRAFGCIRECRAGWKIGPLFADNLQYADIMYRSLCSRVEPGSEVFLDVPETNEAAMQLAQHYAMDSVFETARMYNKEPLPTENELIFGITSFELG